MTELAPPLFKYNTSGRRCQAQIKAVAKLFKSGNAIPTIIAEKIRGRNIVHVFNNLPMIIQRKLSLIHATAASTDSKSSLCREIPASAFAGI